MKAAVEMAWLCLPPSNIGEILVTLCQGMAVGLGLKTEVRLSHHAVFSQAPASL